MSQVSGDGELSPRKSSPRKELDLNKFSFSSDLNTVRARPRTVNIRTASKEALQTVRGVGETIAQDICTWRESGRELDRSLLTALSMYTKVDWEAFIFPDEEIDSRSGPRPKTSEKGREHFPEPYKHDVYPPPPLDSFDFPSGPNKQPVEQMNHTRAEALPHYYPKGRDRADQYLDNHRREAQPRFPGRQGRPRYDWPDIDRQEGYRFIPDQPKIQLPVGMTFDGSHSWEAFKEKFSLFLARNQLHDFPSAYYYFIMALRGEPEKYFTQSMTRLRLINMDEVFQFMANRYGQRVVRQAAVARFNVLEQFREESSQAWQGRVWTAAYHAFPGLPSEDVEPHVVARFIGGLVDREAVQYLACQDLDTMSQVLDKLDLFNHSKYLSGKQSFRARQVEHEYGDEIDPESYAIKQIRSEGLSSGTASRPRYDRAQWAKVRGRQEPPYWSEGGREEKPWNRTEEAIVKLTDQVSEIASMLKKVMEKNPG